MCDFEWDHSDESKWVWEAAVQETQGYHHYVETRAWLCGPVFTSVNALPDVEAGLALIEDLEILPWHVSTGCCPGELTGEHRRGASAQGTIRRQSSCMWGGFTAAEQVDTAT